MAQYLLTAGANDLGGTLINESISTSAGASHGQLVSPAELRRMIRDLGRLAAQRSTTYQLLRVFDGVEEEEHPLDRIDDAEERFGSYRTLTASHAFRYSYGAYGSRLTAGEEGS